MADKIISNEDNVPPFLKNLGQYSFFLVWIFALSGFLFLMVIVNQYRVLINDINSRKTQLSHFEAKTRVLMNGINGDLTEGKKSLDQLFYKDTSGSKDVSTAWINDLAKLTQDYINTDFSPEIAKLLGTIKQSQTHLHSGIEEVFNWKGKKQRNQELTRQYHRQLKDLFNAVMEILHNNLSSQGSLVNDLSTAVTNTALLVEQLQEIENLDQFQLFKTKKLDRSLRDINTRYSQIKDTALMQGLLPYMIKMKMLLYGTLKEEMDRHGNGLLPLIRENIRLEKSKELLFTGLLNDFDAMQLANNQIFIALDAKITDFQQEIDHELKYMLRKRIHDALFGSLCLFIFALITAETIRRQTYRLGKASRELLIQKNVALNSIKNLTGEINKRKSVEEEIKRLIASQKAILENAGSAIITTDKQGLITSFNPAAEKMLGFEAHEMVGKLTPVVFHDGHEIAHKAEIYGAELGIALKPGFDVFIIKSLKNMVNIDEWTYVKRDGTRFPVLLIVSALKDEQNNIFGYLGVATDISYSKKILKELEDQKNALDQSAIVAITDVRGVITYVNDNFCKISKFSKAELLGQDHRIINSGYHPPEFIRQMWQTIAHGQVWKGEIRNKAKDGNFYWVDTTIIPFLNDAGKPFQYVSIRWDITEQYKARQEIINKNKDLEEANQKALMAMQAKSNFLANMSHEIRTPMNAIIGFADLLKRHTALTEVQQEYLKTIETSSQLLLSIINDILDFSKLESGNVKLEHIDFNLEYLLSDTFKMIVPRLREKGLDSFLDISPEVPLDVKGDPTRLKQVVINLLGNAIKFTESGTIGIKVRFLSKDAQAIRLEFDISDTGIGISEKHIKKLFNPFSQADESTTRKFGGTGLGLTICKSLIEAMQGRIWIESVEGQGSHFIFEVVFGIGVPVVDRLIMPVPVDAIKGRKIMIVDDNANSREILCAYAKGLGLQVMACCASGQEGLSSIDDLLERGEKLDIVFTDVLMPQMNGYEFCRILKENPRLLEVKVLAITSDIRLGMLEQARAFKFDGYLPKPFARTDLIKIMTVMLGDQRPVHELTPVTRHMADELGCKGLRILVVDDVKANQDLLKAYLTMWGCVFTCLNNGQEAVDFLRDNWRQCDICLMDLQMPQMSGDEAARIIRKEISVDFPIIALTAAALKEDQQKCMEAGMNDYLTKPFNLTSLKNTLLRYGKKIV